MRKTKWIAVTLLALCFCVLPVYAEPVDAVVEVLAPLTEGYEAVTMVCPLAVPESAPGEYAVYFELEPITQDLWLEVKLGKQTIASTALIHEDGAASAYVTVKAPSATETLGISILDRQGGQAVYQNSAILLGFTKHLSFDWADAVACTPATTVSVISRDAAVTACLPQGTELPKVALYGQIVDQNGAVYGTSSEAAVIADCMVPDARFSAIFQKNPYQVSVQTLQAEIRFSRLPDPGCYDLIFVDARGTECYRFEEVVQCDDRPAIQLMGWTAVPGDQADYAEVALFLANGAPADFSLELYQGGRLYGESQGFSVIAYDREAGGVYLAYPFRLETPLEAGQVFTAKIHTDEAYHGDASCLLEAVRTEAGTIFEAASGFDSAYFANVLLKTTGFTPQRQYKAVLELDERALAESLVTCDGQGWFDIAFLDADGKPLSLAPGASYSVSLYRWESGGQWIPVDRATLQTMEAAALPTDGDRFCAQAEGLSVGNIVVNDRLSLRYGEAADLQLQLFGQQNQGALPDFLETLWQKQSYTIADENAALFSAQRYRSVYWRGDRVVGAEPGGYWVNARCMQDYLIMQEWGIPNFTVSIEETRHGAVQLFADSGMPVNDQECLNFTEIYVHATPDPGYVVEEILVNDVPITGRAFLLAENAEVAVTFRPRRIETFSIHLRHSTESTTYGGVFHCALEQAALEDLVTLIAQPEEGFWMMGVRVFETETGLEVPLQAGETPDTWQFAMPATPVTAEVTFQAKIRAEILSSYDITAGMVSVPGFVWEGDTVTITAKPYEGCTLEELWLVYNLSGEEQKENLLEHPGSAPDSYCFRVPGVDTLWLYPVFQEHCFTISLSEPSPMDGTVLVSQPSARPGKRIGVTVMPNDGYRLTEGSLTVCTEAGDALPLTPSETPMVWTFIMPWNNVQVSAVFESTEPEVTGVTVQHGSSGALTVNVQMRNAAAEVSLAAALYDAEGRLVGVTLQTCVDGAAIQSLSVTHVGTPVAGRLFFLKTENCTPLIEAIPLRLPQ